MSTEVGQVSGIKIHAGTAAGAAYVNKVTHPPSPMSSEYQGRPDCSAPNVVLMELKAELNVPPIITLPTAVSTVKTINPSSILFVQSSGAVVMNYIFMFVADSALSVSGWIQPQSQATTASQPTVSQTVPPSVNSAGYNFQQWMTDIGSHRKTYKSSTYYLNATNFNNQGIVTSAKFKPDIIQGPSLLTLFEQHNGDHKSSLSLLNAVRASCSHLGYTFRGNADDFQVVNKDGVVVPGEQMSYQIWEWGTQTGNKGNVIPNSSQIYYNNLFPSSSSQLLVSSPKAATRPAREGSFTVLQQEDEIIPWVSNYSTSSTTAGQPPGLNLSFMRYVQDGTTAIYIPLYSQLAPGNTFSPYTAEVPWSSLDWSFTLFEGLTVPTTVGTSLTSVPYITVKSFVGLELQPRPNSSLVTFQRTLPLPDNDAIRMAIGIMHARPDSLPAAANDLGSIAMTAMKFIPTAVSWLKDIFGSKKKEDKTEVKPKNKTPQKKPSRAPVPSRYVRSQRNPDKKLEAKISSLSRAVRSMQVSNNKAAAPATRLPRYDEVPKQQRVPKPQRVNKQYNPKPGMSLREYLATAK